MYWTHLKKIIPFFLALTLCGFGLSGCLKFNNPAEDVELEKLSGRVKVQISGIDPEATVLVADLSWTEVGVSGVREFRKTFGVSDETDLEVIFDGLPPGRGAARAGSYVGTLSWQPPVWSEEVQIEKNGETSTSIALGTADGDLDVIEIDYNNLPDGDPIDPESDQDLDESTTETDEDLDSDTENETDSDTEVIDPAQMLEVPYTPTTPLWDGRLYLESPDNRDWEYAEKRELTTPDGQTVIVLAMHTYNSVLFGFHLPNTVGAKDDNDELVVAIDPNPAVADDEFLLRIRLSTSRSCMLLDLTPCQPGDPLYSLFFDTTLLGETTEGTAWEVELVLPYSSLGLSEGVSKTLGLAIEFIDNLETASEQDSVVWPSDAAVLQPSTNPDPDPETWGRMSSPHNWTQHLYPTDGDTDDDVEQDRDTSDADLPDLDQDTTDASEPDTESEPDTDTDTIDTVTDGDVDTDSEPDSDLELEVICVANSVLCVDVQGVPHEQVCNVNGTAYLPDATCDDNYICTTDVCLSGTGCSNNLNTVVCDDGNACTTNDRCNPTFGGCMGEAYTCTNGNPCQDGVCDRLNCTDENNPSTCCTFTAVADDPPQSCEDQYACTTNETCTAGACTGDYTEGCCEGPVGQRDDMALIGDSISGYCIDLYEAVIGNQTFSVLATPPCTVTSSGQRYGGNLLDDYPGLFPDDITSATQPEPEGDRLFACNSPLITPSVMMTRAQAEVACQNVNKRLCTETELKAACAGTPPDQCNDDGGLQYTGDSSYSACVQSDSVHDLLGNVEEWSVTGTVCGASYADDLTSLTCESACPAQATPTNATGFRCCADNLDMAGSR